MQSDADDASFLARLLAALHDVATSLCCVAYWAGMWCLLDALAVNELVSGCIAIFLVIILAAVKADLLLEKFISAVPTAIQVMSVWLWTCGLAVLSLVVWRIGFFCVHKFLLPGNNVHAVSVALIGIALLILAGRYRSASCAPPVGVVVDIYSPGTRFPPAAFSGHKVGEASLDVLLTIPVVLTWAGIWMLLDNLAVPPVLCGLVCFGWIALCGIFSISDLLRVCCAGVWVVSAVADVMWTSLKTVACIGVWRGTWEAAFEQLGLQKAPHAAATFLVGAVGLTLLMRHRSAMFPPVDFSSDDGDHFHAVGSSPFDTGFSEKDPVRQRDSKVPEETNHGSIA